jgi:hypothetical protein
MDQSARKQRRLTSRSEWDQVFAQSAKYLKHGFDPENLGLLRDRRRQTAASPSVKRLAMNPNYYGGAKVMVGDRVRLWKGELGRVVCSLDQREFSDEYPEKDWGNLRSGVLIAADSGDVFHYEEADEDFELIRRQK